MKKVICVFMFLFCCNAIVWAQQYTVELSTGKQQMVNVQLKDLRNGNNLLPLPITFQLTDTNYLVMIVGNGSKLINNYTVWMFSEPKSVKDFIKSNHNVSVGKIFKTSCTQFDVFFKGNDQIMLFTNNFDNDFEIIQKNPKPVFFKIRDVNANVITLELNFYVAVTNPTNTCLFEFTAQTRPVTVTLKLIKN